MNINKELLKLQINEKRLKTAQSLAGIGNWEFDIVNNELYWSDEIFNIFEINKHSFHATYESFLNAIHPEDRELVNNTYINSLKTKEKYTIRHRLLMSDNRIKYVEEKCVSYFDTEGKPVKSIGTVQDVTEQHLLEIELQKTLSFLNSYKLAMDESSIVSKADEKGIITYVNDNFCKISGYSKEELLGQSHNIIRHPDNPKELFEDLWTTIKEKKVWKKILKNQAKNGNEYWVDISILPILDENEDIVKYMAVRHDITKEVLQKKELERIANTDTLTGLGNRYKLINDIQDSVQPALAILNLDDFSKINDFYGHEVGDMVIKQFGSKLIENNFHDDCMLYHLHGDEYVLFHKNINREKFLIQLFALEKKLKQITIPIQDEIYSFSFCIAVSFENKENLLTTGNMALKIAKRENKNFLVYNDELSLNSEYENNIKWSKKIKDALENDGFVSVFQPIVNNDNGKWEKYECLVRMKDDDKLISPYFFLDISKKTKHYTQITKLMIEKSFQAFQHSNKEFSINLTIEDILDYNIQTFIFLMLEQYKIGSKVVFEIVESESIENFEEVSSFIKSVKSYDCKVAIDDFGTGYSNFEYLVQLEADYIKIDGSLIKDIDTNKTSQIVVRNIINFAKDLNMKTIAEFVENESILNKIKELGIEYAQGYYFSPPQREFDE